MQAELGSACSLAPESHGERSWSDPKSIWSQRIPPQIYGERGFIPKWDHQASPTRSDPKVIQSSLLGSPNEQTQQRRCSGPHPGRPTHLSEAPRG